MRLAISWRPLTARSFIFSTCSRSCEGEQNCRPIKRKRRLSDFSQNKHNVDVLRFDIGLNAHFLFDRLCWINPVAAIVQGEPASDRVNLDE
jgi:hypothetical protein